MSAVFCGTLAPFEFRQIWNAPFGAAIVMKSLLNLCIAAAAAGTLSVVASLAFAQNSPGIPGGILQDQFRLQEHPQLEFAASAPSKKYQNGRSKLRKRGDYGDPNGCNLQCPDDAQ